MTELKLKAVVESIPEVTEFINGKLEALACSAKAKLQINVAIDELVCNIARYAYGRDTGDVTVQFDYDRETGLASISFMDSGVPFNPLEKSDPDISLPAAERRIGGLGIFLVRKTMDKMEYRYENGMNILTISKKII